jgi:transposase
MGDRVSRPDSQIERVVDAAPAATKAVIEALQALRGVAKLTAITIVTEVGTFRRFRKPTDLMGYAGLVPSEYPSGSREARGRNWKAQERLHRKFTKLTFHRKPSGKVATAVARELTGFVWAIGHLVETQTPGRAA